MQVKAYTDILKESILNPSNGNLKESLTLPFESLKKFAGTNIGKLGISLTSIFAAYKAFKAVDSKFGLTYNGAYGNTSKSLKVFKIQNRKLMIYSLRLMGIKNLYNRLPQIMTLMFLV